MTFHVRVLSDADRDVDVILDWLLDRSVSGAERWADAYQAALIALRDSPDRHSLASEAEVVNQPIRQVFFRTQQGRRYRIIFLIVEREVQVLRIRAPGERPLNEHDIP